MTGRAAPPRLGYAAEVSELAWQPIAARVATAAANAGLDLAQAFSVSHYNASAAESERLEDFGRPHALGLLIGNTRKLWPAFTRAYAGDAQLANAEHPLDTYVVTRLTQLLQDATTAHTQLVFAHVTTPRAFPIQRLAERVGLAAVSPSHLALHALHGPWIALRAVVVVDVAGPEGPAMAPERPCQACSAPCMPALARALAASGPALSSASVSAHADEWVAVRDACPVGQGSRYGNLQLAYHYAPKRSRILPDP